MGGHLTKPSNKNMVDRLVEKQSYIHTAKVEGVFRAVDRAMYYEIEEGEPIDPYEDDPWRRGNLHLSAPCIYAKVVEALHLHPGVSFLNLGSGTGYLNTIVGLLIGPNGLNHGIELHKDVVDYAYKKLQQFKDKSCAIDKYDFSEPLFIRGNCVNLDPNVQYDRIYLGAACLPEMEMFMKKLVKINGGILVMPYENHLMRHIRISENEWQSEKLMDVNFTLMIGRNGNIINGNGDEEEINNGKMIEMPTNSARSLKELCRIVIRQQLRHKTNLMNPNLLNSDNVDRRRHRRAMATLAMRRVEEQRQRARINAALNATNSNQNESKSGDGMFATTHGSCKFCQQEREQARKKRKCFKCCWCHDCANVNQLEEVRNRTAHSEDTQPATTSSAETYSSERMITRSTTRSVQKDKPAKTSTLSLNDSQAVCSSLVNRDCDKPPTSASCYNTTSRRACESGRFSLNRNKSVGRKDEEYKRGDDRGSPNDSDVDGGVEERAQQITQTKCGHASTSCARTRPLIESPNQHCSRRSGLDEGNQPEQVPSASHLMLLKAVPSNDQDCDQELLNPSNIEEDADEDSESSPWRIPSNLFDLPPARPTATVSSRVQRFHTSTFEELFRSDRSLTGQNLRRTIGRDSFWDFVGREEILYHANQEVNFNAWPNFSSSSMSSSSSSSSSNSSASSLASSALFSSPSLSSLSLDLGEEDNPDVAANLFVNGEDDGNADSDYNDDSQDSDGYEELMGAIRYKGDDNTDELDDNRVRPEDANFDDNNQDNDLGGEQSSFSRNFSSKQDIPGGSQDDVDLGHHSKAMLVCTDQPVSSRLRSRRTLVEETSERFQQTTENTPASELNVQPCNRTSVTSGMGKTKHSQGNLRHWLEHHHCCRQSTSAPVRQKPAHAINCRQRQHTHQASNLLLLPPPALRPAISSSSRGHLYSSIVAHSSSTLNRFLAVTGLGGRARVSELSASSRMSSLSSPGNIHTNSLAPANGSNAKSLQMMRVVRPAPDGTSRRASGCGQSGTSSSRTSSLRSIGLRDHNAGVTGDDDCARRNILLEGSLLQPSSSKHCESREQRQAPDDATSSQRERLWLVGDAWQRTARDTNSTARSETLFENRSGAGSNLNQIEPMERKRKRQSSSESSEFSAAFGDSSATSSPDQALDRRYCRLCSCRHRMRGTDSVAPIEPVRTPSKHSPSSNERQTTTSKSEYKGRSCVHLRTSKDKAQLFASSSASSLGCSANPRGASLTGATVSGFSAALGGPFESSSNVHGQDGTKASLKTRVIMLNKNNNGASGIVGLAQRQDWGDICARPRVLRGSCTSPSSISCSSGKNGVSESDKGSATSGAAAEADFKPTKAGKGVAEPQHSTSAGHGLAPDGSSVLGQAVELRPNCNRPRNCPHLHQNHRHHCHHHHHSQRHRSHRCHRHNRLDKHRNQHGHHCRRNHNHHHRQQTSERLREFQTRRRVKREQRLRRNVGGVGAGEPQIGSRGNKGAKAKRRENECEKYRSHISAYIKRLPLPRVLHEYLNFGRQL